MRRDILHRLVLRHPGRLANLVRKFLKKEKPLVADDQDVSFDDFVVFIRKTYAFEFIKENAPQALFHYFDIPVEQDQKSILHNASDSQLFSIWMGSKEKPKDQKKIVVVEEKNEEKREQKRWMLVYLGSLDHAVFPRVLLPFLDDQSLFFWLRTCKPLYETTKKASYWQDRLARFMADTAPLNNVIRRGPEKAIRNYRLLYQSLVTQGVKRALSEWELLYSSGDPQAIDYAEKEKLITEETRSTFRGQPPLFLVINSGSIAGIERVRASKVMALYHNNAEKETALHWAAWAGRVDVFNWLLALNVFNPMDKNNIESTLLHFAAQSGNVEMLERVLEAFPRLDPLAKSTRNRTLAFWAVASGRLKMIDKVFAIPNIDLSARERGNDLTLLQYAVRNSSEEVIRELAHRNPSAIKKRWSVAQNPLIYLALARPLNILEAVLELGADPLAANVYGKTALHFCAAEPQVSLEIMDRLIAIPGMDLLAKSTGGSTLFHWAASFSSDSSRLLYFRALFYQKLGFDFDPATPSNTPAQDVFWFARQQTEDPKKLKEVQDAFAPPIQDVIKTTKPVPKKIFHPEKKSNDTKRVPPQRNPYKIAPDEIVHHLLLGDRHCDEIYLKKLVDEKKLIQCNFALLRCPPSSFPLPTGIRREDVERLPSGAFLSPEMNGPEIDGALFDNSFEFISDALKQDKVIVVYGHNGVYAPAIVAAYLMREYGCDAKTAIDYVDSQSSRDIDVSTTTTLLENYRKKPERQKTTEKKSEENPEENAAGDTRSAILPEAKAENPTRPVAQHLSLQQARQSLSLCEALLAQAMRLQPYYKSIGATLAVLGCLSTVLGMVLMACVPPMWVGSVVMTGGALLAGSGCSLFDYATRHPRAPAAPATGAALRP